MRSASSAGGAWLVFTRLSRFLARRRLELAPHLVEAHRHCPAGANQVCAHFRLGPPPGGRRRSWRGEERAQSREETRRQHRLEVLERGASHVGVVSAERPRRDSHRLPFQGKREQIEDMLSDQLWRAIATELSLDQ